MSKSNDFVNQWGVFGKTMLFYRWIALVSVVTSLVAAGALIVFKSLPPLVVVKEGKTQHFSMAQRNAISIESSDVEQFAKDFIRDFYTLGSTPCRMASGLQKLALKRQKISQYVGRIEITLKEKTTLASFDLIVSVKNIPLVVRKQVRLQITQGKRTACNPLGLYVNGIEEQSR